MPKVSGTPVSSEAVISPIVAPRVIATNPPDMAVVPLPLSQLTVTFDQDMYAGAGTDSASVLNTANFQVVRQNGGLATITGVSYDAATRTAIPVLQPATAASEPANVRQQSQQVQDQYRKALEGALQQARPMPEEGK